MSINLSGIKFSFIDFRNRFSFTRILHTAGITKVLICVLIANILMFAFGNAFKIPVQSVAVIYPLFFCLAAVVVFPAYVRRRPYKISKGMIWWMMVFFICLSLPRISYVLEWLPGNTVHVFADDEMRLGQIISMTASQNFPLKLFANPEYTFAYYYAGLFPFAFFKLAIPFLTIKDAVFLGNAFYMFLILFSMLEVANLLLPTRRSLWIMVFLCTAFGGFEWAANMILHKSEFIAFHYRWAHNSLFHGDAMINSYFLNMFWNIHHVASFIGCILFFVTLNSFYFKCGKWKYLVSGLLLISSFYSSVFSFWPVLLFCLVKFKLCVKRLADVRIFIPLLSVFLVSLPVYLQKVMSQQLFPSMYQNVTGFYPAQFHIAFTNTFLLDKIVSFPIWLILITFIELGFIPLVLLYYSRFFSRTEKIIFILSLGIYVSTYVIGYSYYNLYSMRGMLIPTFVFFYLLAKYLPQSPWVQALIARTKGRLLIGVLCFVLSLGILSEFICHTLLSVHSMALTSHWAQGFRPERDASVNYREIARDHSILFFEPPDNDHGDKDYNAEKMMRIPLDQMLLGDKESLGIPAN